MSTETPGTAPLTSNLKMLQLLDLLAETENAVGVSELARLAGSSRSVVHRQLVTLAAAGWVENLSNGSYRLTLRPMRLGQAALQHAGVDERLRELLESAARRLGEVVSLGALDGDAVVVVDRGLPRRGVSVSVSHGHRFPLDDSALGQVLAAYLSDGEREAMRRGAQAFPSERSLAAVRGEGHAAWRDTEFDPIDVVAVPVGREVGNVRYALCAHWPQSRISKDAALTVLEPLAREAREILSLAQALG